MLGAIGVRAHLPAHGYVDQQPALSRRGREAGGWEAFGLHPRPDDVPRLARPWQGRGRQCQRLREQPVMIGWHGMGLDEMGYGLLGGGGRHVRPSSVHSEDLNSGARPNPGNCHGRFIVFGAGEGK